MPSMPPNEQDVPTASKRNVLLVASIVLFGFSILNFMTEIHAATYTSTQFRQKTEDALSKIVVLHGGANSKSGYLQTHSDLTQLQEQGEQSNTQDNNQQNFVPLADYVPRSPDNIQCPPGTQFAPMVVNPMADSRSTSSRKIPPIVHITGKTVCLTPTFINVMERWSFDGYSMYFHDDQAVDELMFQRDWPMFPQLKNSMACLENAGGAAKADLWRYLALWEYGGIYTDMDNLPGQYFNNETVNATLIDDMDALFVQEGGGFISQYFFAVSPHHPLMFLAVQDVMREMSMLDDTGNFHVPSKTGPGATKRAFIWFMGLSVALSDPEEIAKYSKPSAGTYTGEYGNRSVTVVGTKSTGNNWCIRSAIHGQAKKQGWQAMNITSYHELNQQPSHKSCFKLLYDLHNTNPQQEERRLLESMRRRRW